MGFYRYIGNVLIECPCNLWPKNSDDIDSFWVYGEIEGRKVYYSRNPKKRRRSYDMNGISEFIDRLPLHKSTCPIKGMYFLYNNDELVYIGQSNSNIYHRIESHKLDKKFTHFKVLELSDDFDLLEVETNLIKHFTPCLNKEIFLRTSKKKRKTAVLLLDLILKSKKIIP